MNNAMHHEGSLVVATRAEGFSKLFRASCAWLVLACMGFCSAGEPAGPSAEGTRVLAATVQPNVVPGGAFVKIQYRWESARPLNEALTIFVHVRNKAGQMVLQDDHQPPVGTATPGWLGAVSYERRLVLPPALPDGEYVLQAGLYNKAGKASLQSGDGVSKVSAGTYKIGAFIISRQAPRPPADTEKRPSLNLNGFQLVFNEDFKQPLDVSAWGPGTRWIAHTPWHGDFGDAVFVDPKEAFPFQTSNHSLSITARKNETRQGQRKWESGLLASNDPKGNGFAQQYGYFEVRAKLPPGPGVWPAFWLCSSYDRTDPKAGKDGSLEIDVFEYYGHSPHAYSATVHVWSPAPHRAEGKTIMTRENEPSGGFHNYGVLVDARWLTFYFDGIEVWKTATPPEHNKPLMLLVNLALGSGWPIDKTLNPSTMEIQYVRAWTQPKVDSP